MPACAALLMLNRSRTAQLEQLQQAYEPMKELFTDSAELAWSSYGAA